MDLRSFPFDRQICMLTFESFNYNIAEVEMRWHPQYPVTLLHNIRAEWGHVKDAGEFIMKPITLADYELVEIKNSIVQTVKLGI